MTESEEKRLQIIREKMEQMKQQEKKIIARDKERQRKERNRRLFLYGHLVEIYFKDIEPIELEILLQETKERLNDG